MSPATKKGFIADFVQQISGFNADPDNADQARYQHAAEATSKSIEDSKKQAQQVDHQFLTRSFNDILKDKEIRDILFTSNIFILGRIGNFDRIVKQLVAAYQKYAKHEVTVLHTEPELLEYKQAQKDRTLPVVFIPAARSRENLSHLVTLALELHVPLWLVALPSHLETQLLLSFKSLFIATAPETELQPLFEIMDIQPEYKAALVDKNIKAVLLIGSRIDKRSKPNEFGYTIGISAL